MMSEIIYRPDLMDSDQLKVEMILSSLVPQHVPIASHYIKATDGLLLYEYKTDEIGYIMTGKIISLLKPSLKLRILEMKNITIDKERMSIFELLVEFDNASIA